MSTLTCFIYHHNAFREHGLPERPYAVHDFARMARIRLCEWKRSSNCERCLPPAGFTSTISGKVSFNEREEDALNGFTHPGVFHGGLPTMVWSRWAFTVRNACGHENRVFVFKRIETGMVAEGPSVRQFISLT